MKTRKINVTLGIIAAISIIIIGYQYFNNHFSNEGILENVTTRNGYVLNQIDEPVTVKTFIKPEWISFESDKKQVLDKEMAEIYSTNIILDYSWNRGRDICFAFESSYNMNYNGGKFLYNGKFNEDGSFTYNSKENGIILYSINQKKLDIGQWGVGTGSSFSFCVEPQYYEEIKDGFYVEYTDYSLYEYTRK